MATAWVGTGTTLVFGTSAFSCEILDISGPNTVRETVDVTHMGSVGAKEFIASSLVDNGELKVDVLFDPTNNALLDNDGSIAQLENEVCTMTFPDGGTTYAFDCVCTAFEVKTPLEDKMTASATWKISGLITRVDRT